MPIRIDAADDPRIADYVGLRDRKELTEEIVSGLKKAAEEFKGLFSVK